MCTHHRIQRIIVNLHHLGEHIVAELGDGDELAAEISYSAEDELLGTGGGIKAMAAKMPRETCVVVNGKVIADVDLTDVVAQHRKNSALATMVLCPVPNPERWGAVGVDQEGHLVRLLDATTAPDSARRDCMFTGIQVLEPEFIDAIADGPGCVVRGAYRELFARGAPLFGQVHEGYFHEHSTPQRYLQGNFNLLRGAVDLPFAPVLRGVDPSAQVHRSAQVHEPILVGPRAVVEPGARIGPLTVLGAGCRVRSGVGLQESVVWPNVTVTADGQHSIITPSQLIDGSAARAAN